MWPHINIIVAALDLLVWNINTEGTCFIITVITNKFKLLSSMVMVHVFLLKEVKKICAQKRSYCTVILSVKFFFLIKKFRHHYSMRRQH